MKKSSPNGLPFWKRALDCTIILLFLPLWLVAGLVVILVIRCGSRGPVLFCQERLGYKEQLFTCYKFRTMRLDAKTDSHRDHARRLIDLDLPMTKLDSTGDPRLVPFGALLRASGLDELPQVINVLAGEMSIVGPRPCIPYEYELYSPWQRRRLEAVPGLTGLWQVSGKNRTTFNEMIRFDIEYSERASLQLDLAIIVRTLPALWTQFRDLRPSKRMEVMAPSGIVAKPVES